MDPIALICELAAAALQGRRIEPRADVAPQEWRQLLGVCAAQRVHTFLYDALPESGVPEDVLTLWKSQADANQRASRLVAAIVEAQETAWKKRGLRYALLKGPALAALYPVPEHRCCGDIDWWFAEGGSWKAALEPAGRNAENGLHRDSDGDVSYRFKGVDIEHHRDWTHLSSRRLRHIAGDPAVIGGRLGPEDTLLTLMCHILHHVAWSGVNFKQMTDLAVALKVYDGVYDKRHLEQRLEALGLTKWAAFLADVVPDLTGIGEDLFPVEPKASDKDRQRFVEVLFEASPRLATRVRMMWKYSKTECVARYLYLILGKLGNIKSY